MKKLQNRAPAIICCVLIIVFWSCFMMIQQKSGIHEEDYVYLKKGWTASVGGAVYTDINIEEFHFPSQGKGDEPYFEIILPECNVKNPVLYIYSVHSAVEIFLDQSKIFEYGMDCLENNKLVGYGKQYIDLPDDYAGKTLLIKLYVTENDSFGSFETPQICNGNNAIRDLAIINALPLTINLFLVTFGTCILIISAFFLIKNKQFSKLMCVGLFSIGIGLWSLCSYNLLMLFTYDLKVKTYLEYTALYTCPLPVLLYFKEDIMKRNIWVRRFYMGLEGVMIAFIAVSVILQITNIAHFPAVLRGMHIILLVTFITIIGYFAHDLIKRRLERKVLMAGILIMIGIGVLDVLRFNIIKYIPVLAGKHYTSILCLGALIFVMSQIGDFAMEVSRILYKAAEKETLEKIAYTDALTGISNRRKCEEVFDELDKGNNYGILAFDLNNLKKMNDSNGHEKGDLLIKTFAQTLESIFGEYGTVGRMGGDEFMVLFPDMSKVNLDSLIVKFEEKTKQVNEQMPELMNMSAAYGYCGRTENPHSDAREIYRMADAKMYEKKIAMKCARQ